MNRVNHVHKAVILGLLRNSGKQSIIYAVISALGTVKYRVCESRVNLDPLRTGNARRDWIRRTKTVVYFIPNLQGIYYSFNLLYKNK